MRSLRRRVGALGGRRQDLAHPIRRKSQECRVRQTPEALTLPARDIGHGDVVAEVQLGFAENPSAARPSPSLIERGVQGSNERGPHSGVPNSRSRRDDELALENFSDEMIGDATQILVGGGPVSRPRFVHDMTRTQ